MSDLEEFEKERRNKEYMEDAKTGVIAVGLQNCGARTASNEMCIFLIAYRSQYGSANPAADCACGCGYVNHKDKTIKPV